MIRSMTGFGSASGQFNGNAISVEIKSVNNRFREILSRMPKICAPFEEAIKKMVSAKVERGRLDLWVQFDERSSKKKQMKVDFELAREINSILNELRNHLDIREPVSLSQVLSLGVISPEDENPDLEALWEILEPLVDEAVDALISMREAEGQNLSADIEKRLNRLVLINRKVEELSSSAPDMLLEKLQNRLTELGNGIKIDPNRLAQEAAFLADKADITEEVVRLNSHLERFSNIIKDNEPSGRRLDFLIQEMGREINTMGSKTQDLEVTGLVLDMKADLEKLREQAQNIE